MGRNVKIILPISKCNPHLIQHRFMKVGRRIITIEWQIYDLTKKGAVDYCLVDLGQFRGRFKSFIKK